MSSIVAHLYLFFSQHRSMVFVATLASIIVSVITFAHLNLNENIESMLPDNKTNTAFNFKLLQQAPFSRKVVINLKKGANGSENELMEAADRLAQAMTPPFFTHVVSGTGESLNLEFLLWMINAYPSLFAEADINKIQEKLAAATVSQKLKELYAKLLSPEGLGMKRLFQVDPLDFRLNTLEKLRFLNIIPRMRIEKGHFISPDGKNLTYPVVPYQPCPKHNRIGRR